MTEHGNGTTAAVEPAAVTALFTTRTRPRAPLISFLTPLLAPLGAVIVLGVCAHAMSPVDGILQRSVAAVFVLLMSWWCAKAAPLQAFPALELCILGGCLLASGIAMWVVVRDLSALLLMLGASLLGIAAVRALEQLVWVAPVLAAAAAMDVHSFSTGPTSTLLESGSRVERVTSVQPEPELIALIRLMLQLPIPDGTWLFGAVDVAAIALLCAAAHRFGLPVRRSAIAVGFAASAVIMLGRPAPVLPAICAAFAVVHVRPMMTQLGHAARRLRV